MTELINQWINYKGVFLDQQEGLLWPNSLQTKVKKKKNSIYRVIFLLVVFEDLTNLKKNANKY